jgi:Family of unknown function (DUF5678)
MFLLGARSNDRNDMTVAELVKAEKQLGDSLEAYAGEWVAVVDHAVIAHDADLEGLLEQVESETLEDATVYQVPHDHGAACFF